jgi:hypothetical protein
LKSELQVARLRLEGEDYANAEMTLRRVINSPYADDVLRTLAQIELGWILARGKKDRPLNEQYDRAMREFSILTPEKQRLIRDSLPARVRAEWENIDYLYKESLTTSDTTPNARPATPLRGTPETDQGATDSRGKDGVPVSDNGGS